MPSSASTEHFRMDSADSPDPTAPGGPLFNPHTQIVHLYYPDGSNYSLPLTEFNIANGEAIRLVTVFATQVGAGIVLLVIMGLLTKPDRRRTPLFAVNLLALVFVVIRSLLQIMFFLSSWYDTYNYMAWDWTDVPMGDRATSVAASTAALCLEICVELSLILQVRVVFASSTRQVRMLVMACTGAVACLAVGFFAAATVRNAEVVLVAGTYANDWVYRVAKATFAASICLFSFIFVCKLGVAIRQRRILGLEKFGPLQIVFVMACQTMVIPAVFVILEHVVTFDGMGSLTSTLVAISLPLSGMWASARTSEMSASAASNTNFYSDGAYKSFGSTTVNSAEASGRWRHQGMGVAVEQTFDVMSESSGSGKSPGSSPMTEKFDMV